jgi:hypothetical protein
MGRQSDDGDLGVDKNPGAAIPCVDGSPADRISPAVPGFDPQEAPVLQQNSGVND